METHLYSFSEQIKIQDDQQWTSETVPLAVVEILEKLSENNMKRVNSLWSQSRTVTSPVLSTTLRRWSSSSLTSVYLIGQKILDKIFVGQNLKSVFWQNKHSLKSQSSIDIVSNPFEGFLLTVDSTTSLSSQYDSDDSQIFGSFLLTFGLTI